MKKHFNVKYIALYIFILSCAAISLYPFIWMTLNSFKDNVEIFSTNSFGLPHVWQFNNYINAVKNFNIGTYFKNSLVAASGTVVLTCLFACMFSYSVCRMRWKLSKLTYNYLLTGLMIPIVVLIIPLVLTVRNLHLFNSSLGLIFTYTAANVAFASTIFYGFLRTVPYDLEEAACIDGASIFRTFFRIIVPVIKPAIATVAIFIFLNSWNDFTIALVLTNKLEVQTLPLGLITFVGEHTSDWGGMSASMVIASIPTVLIYLLFSESVENALTVGAVSK